MSKPLFKQIGGVLQYIFWTFVLILVSVIPPIMIEESGKAIPIIGAFGFAILAYIFVIKRFKKIDADMRKANKEMLAVKYEKAEYELTEAVLFNFIQSKPDHLITVEMLTDQFGIKKSTARQQLTRLTQFEILKSFTSPKKYYTFAHTIDERTPPELSDKPFLTTDDLLQLFMHFKGQMTMLDLFSATKLPISVLQREIQYFMEEGVVQRLSATHKMGAYILKEPYRSDPNAFLEKEAEMNLELEEILLRQEQEIKKE